MPVTLSDDTVNALVVHLRTGGTRLESDLLAMRLIEEAQTPQREAAIQKRIDDAVSAATTAAPPIPSGDDAPGMHRLAGGVVDAATTEAVSAT